MTRGRLMKPSAFVFGICLKAWAWAKWACEDDHQVFLRVVHRFYNCLAKNFVKEISENHTKQSDKKKILKLRGNSK